MRSEGSTNCAVKGRMWCMSVATLKLTRDVPLFALLLASNLRIGELLILLNGKELAQGS